MSLKTFGIFLLLIAVITPNIVISQNLYNTRKGTVVVNAGYYDTSITAKTNDLIMILDYASAKLSMKVPLSSFSSGIDSLDDHLRADNTAIISFDGKLGLKNIDTKSHQPLSFDFNGKLSSGNSKVKVYGKGKLQHVSENSEITACILWLTFSFSNKNLKWNLSSYGIGDKINVEIIQAVLKKQK